MPHLYETDGAAIYRRSFRDHPGRGRPQALHGDEESVVVRMIHAAGMVDLEAGIRFTSGMASITRAALQNGAPILCDARMVSEGITRSRLPADNAVICTLSDPPCRRSRNPCTTPVPLRRSNYGGRIWRDRLSRSAMRRPRCSIC